MSNQPTRNLLNPKNKPKKKSSKVLRLTGILFLFTIILNIAGCSTSFCDWYRSHIYGWLSDGYSRITSLFPWPLGELCMYVGAVLLILFVISIFFLLFFHKKAGYRRFAGGLAKAVFLIGILILNLYTLFWVIPIRSSPLTVTGNDMESGKLEELEQIYTEMVNQCNALSGEVDRDETGAVIYPEEDEMQALVIRSMKKAGETNPRLSGYYPRLKTALCSDVLDWMGIGGYTYPFTMEITYNKYVDKLYLMNLYAHELAHHKGYYLENEGVFISYVTGINSGNALLEYSAYTSLLSYVVNDLNKALAATMTEDEIKTLAASFPSLDDQVYEDMQESQDNAKALYNADSHPLEKFKKEASDAADTGWSVQTKILKEYSYSGVVRLLLEYYRDEF